MLLILGWTWVTAVDGVAVAPTVGLSLGWVVSSAFVYALLSGKLMTRSAHEEQMTVAKDTYQRQVDDIAHDRTEWRTEGRIKDAQYETGVTRNHELLTEVAQTVLATFEAMKASADASRGGGSSS